MSEQGYSIIRIREDGLKKTDRAVNIFTDYKNAQYKRLEEPIIKLLNALGHKRIDIDIERDYVEILQMLVNSNKDRSILRLYPELALDWDTDKNGEITPDMVSPKSRKIVNWKCHKCGFEWKTRIVSRVTTDGRIRLCPVCSDRIVKSGVTDFLSITPEMEKYWDYEKNVDLNPKGVTSFSHKEAYWHCDKCGFHWKRRIYEQSSSKGCPVCNGHKVLSGFNDFATQRPELMNEWDFKRNGSINPSLIALSSRKVVWWKCSYCGNSWSTKAYVRSINGNGCPKCHEKGLHKP